MREIGGYIELDRYTLPMLHENAIALNSGRNCVDYLIQAKKIKKILLPYYLCDSVKGVCERYDVSIRYYNINEQFKPINVSLDNDEWLYLVNFYGQLESEYVSEMKRKYERLIVDNVQAYYDIPIEGVDTIYTCRKFFGVSDGAFLYTDKFLEKELPLDTSFERMHFLLGRFENEASTFYGEYVANNERFAVEPLKRMSKLTENLLHGIDYDRVKSQRTINYNRLHEKLCDINQLNLKRITGAFAYPLWIKNGAEVRKKLLKYKIYIPTLWPNVFGNTQTNSLEYDLAANILPLPCDQRYNEEDMDYMVQRIMECIVE